MKNNNTIFPQEVYAKYLNTIKNIKFTPREIDIIACVLQGKSSKGIANFLSKLDKPVGERAVETHILNIRRKIGGSARESIINFIEGSDKYHIVKSYYSSLLIYNEFRKTIQEISLLIRLDESYSFHIVFCPEQENGIFIIDQLQTHLKLILNNVTIEIKQNFIPLSPLPSKLEKNYVIYVLSKQTAEIWGNIKKDYAQDPQPSLPKPEYTSEILFLIYGEGDLDQSISGLPDFKHISLAQQPNYYDLFFEIIKKFSPDIDLDIIIEKFSEKRKNIMSLHGDMPYLPDNQDVREEINDVDIFSEKREPSTLTMFFSGFSFLIITIIIFGFLIIYDKRKQSNQVNPLDSLGVTANNDTIQLLTKNFADLSLNNLTREQSDTNYSIIKQFDKVVEYINSGQITTYLNTDTLTSNELVNCIYNLNALASYYLFKEHDATKAEKILKYAKSSTENYILHRSKVQIDFEKLSPEEIYIELFTIKDLPEMYTLTNYFLGRSFIYQANNKELGEKYFILSNFLGNKTGLFEEVLSIRNGIVIIKSDRIEDNIQKGELEQAKKELKECIDIYEKIKKDGKEYKINYKPNSLSQATIIPKEDIYNVIDCTRRMTKLYTKLINITNNVNEKNDYLAVLSGHFIGDNKSPGTLVILSKSNYKMLRIAAALYNSLGYLLLELENKNFDYKQFKDMVVEKLNLTDTDNLGVICQIFDLAKSLSRNTEFTKADAYDGLIRVYEKRLNQPHIAEAEKNKLLTKIQEFKTARDGINQALTRSITY